MFGLILLAVYPTIGKVLSVGGGESYPMLATDDWVEVIRCPEGWKAVGPFCVTIIAVPPYTECPEQISRFKDSMYNRYKPFAASVCSEALETGPLVGCSPGYMLREVGGGTHQDNDGEEEITVYECVGYESNCGGESPNSKNGEIYGCEIIVDPIVECPPGFVMGFEPINAYAFHKKEYALCGKQLYVKGNMWCPNGFFPHGALFPNLTLGDPIDGGIIERFVIGDEDPSEFLYPLYEWDIVPDWVAKRDIPSCLQVVAVLSTHCSQYECKTKHLDELEDIIARWSYHKLGNADVKKAVYSAIPTGKNLKYTPIQVKT
eukprot:GHVO01011778.1.p1 GENE.GHVO01011778.1~~GHVO01011778.1.p1  ORF type:complete len:318 (+),score=64.89 GHVO01011778.1:285-1238(+)